MPVQPEQEEENWDDDFEFGSSAGSPVIGSQPRGDGTITPENLSPIALGRKRSVSSPIEQKKETNRWSNGSFEDWDAEVEDETINAKGFANLNLPRQPSTPRQNSFNPNSAPRTPLRTPRTSTSSEPNWDDEDEDIDIARSAGSLPAFQSTSSAAPSTNANSIFSLAMPPQRPVVSPSNADAISPSPSTSRAPFPLFSNPNTSSSDAGNIDTSDQPSDTSTSQSSSFFGRLGRRLSKAKPPTTSFSPSNTENTFSSGVFSPPNSTVFSPSSVFSPPTSDKSLKVEKEGKSGSGHSPSKSKVFAFGSSVLKRSGSIGRSTNGNGTAHKASDSVATMKQSKRSTPASDILSVDPNFGLGVQIPANEPHTAPPVLNLGRYTEKPAPGSTSPSTSHMQYSSHIHSKSLAGLGLVGGMNWGAPPSPTGRKNGQRVEMLGAKSLLEKPRVPSGGKTSGDEGKPSHQSSLSTSSAFFSSIRKRSNPLQPASKVPNSAKTTMPPLPDSKPTISQMQIFPAEADLPTQVQISSATQDQAQATRTKRSHRRNISASAMITSVIDEVSSDATISNKLAVQRRERSQKSGLRESTTASEIRRSVTASDLEKEARRLSTSSDRSDISLPRVVSPIEFARSSEESTAGRLIPKQPSFTFPKEMNIRSPMLSNGSPPEEKRSNGKESKGLLPPIELCPPSPEVSLKPSPKDRKLALKQGTSTSSSSSSLTDPAEDQDKTPLALPRRHQPMSNGIRASGLKPPEGEPEVFSAALSASVSAPVSVSSAASSKTLGPGNKLHDAVNGRSSPGISASLGRVGGSNAADKIDGTRTPTGGKVARRNSLTGGTVSTLSNSGSLGGGLKIPANIRAKQDALKRDLNAVRDFAKSIDDLKKLQDTYDLSLTVLGGLCKPTPPAHQDSPSKRLYRMRAASPTPQYHIPRPPSMIEAASQPSSPTSFQFDAGVFETSTSQPMAISDLDPKPVDVANLIPQERKDAARVALYQLDNQYSIWWECADLLVELGSAAPPAVAGTPVRSPTMASLQRAAIAQEHGTPRSRDRNATLPRHEVPSVDGTIGSNTVIQGSSDQSTGVSRRRGSTGQQDLNARQIQLLKGMLSTPNPNDLSSSVDLHSYLAAPNTALSPVISQPSSSIRSAINFDVPPTPQRTAELTGDEQDFDEKEEKRRRRLSTGFAGKLGVKEILASLKRTKEKVMRQKARPVPPSGQEDVGRASTDYSTASASRNSIDQSRSASQAPPSPRPGMSKDNLATPAQTAAPPSPYKRNRRKSLASIFKFGSGSTSQSNDEKMLTDSRSRIDLTSPTPGDGPGFRHGGLGVDDYGHTDGESDWDYMNSPSDVPGRYRTSHANMSSSQDLSHSLMQNRGRSIPVGIPGESSSVRRGTSIVSRSTSTSRHVYNSASASAASLADSSVYGSAASHQSLHEAFGGRGMADREEERRRLKKPTKSPRRPPSSSKRRSQHTSSQTSLSSHITNSTTPPALTSPIMNQSNPSTRAGSFQSQGNTFTKQSNSTHSERHRSPSVTEGGGPRLALTPENIVPLLIYAREVKLKLQECMKEIDGVRRELLTMDILLQQGYSS